MKGVKHYLITDTHFGHKKLIEWGRPEDFEAQIIESLYDLIEQAERERNHYHFILYHLGDFCIGKDEEHTLEYFKVLSCSDLVKITNVLILGNHDNKSMTWYYKMGWDFVVNSLDLTYKGFDIRLTHIPEKVIAFQDYGINIHGHLHDNEHRQIPYYVESYHKRLSLEWEGYQPILLDDFLKKYVVPEKLKAPKKIPF